MGKKINNIKKGVCMMEYRGYRNIYGYKTSTILDRHFVIDDPAAVVVRQMFLWTLEGKNLDEIAEYLNQQSYLAPAEYTKCNNMIMWDEEYSERSLWDSRMVRGILRNKMYTGTLEWVYQESYHEEERRKQRKISIIQGDSDQKISCSNCYNGWIYASTEDIRCILQSWKGTKEKSIYQFIDMWNLWKQIQ